MSPLQLVPVYKQLFLIPFGSRPRVVRFVWRVLEVCEWKVDQDGTDVCKQELIVVEIYTSFKHNNTQITLTLYQQQYFIFCV